MLVDFLQLHQPGFGVPKKHFNGKVLNTLFSKSIVNLIGGS